MAKQTPKKPQPQEVHHYFRTFFASVFGFLAVSLLIVSILVVWLGSTLSNTNQYVKTVAPLVTKPEVRDFVTDKAEEALLDNKDAPVRDIAEQLLGPEKTAGKTDEQLRVEIKPIVDEALNKVISSEVFTNLWKETNRTIHAQLINQLNKNTDSFTLNLHPVIVGVIDELGTTRLSFIKDKLDVKEDMGVVKVEGKQLENVRNVYNYFKKAMIAIVACALLSFALCVLISVHHLKTLRRVALSIGIFSALLAMTLSATSLIKVNGTDAQQKQMALTLVDVITHDLRVTLIFIAVACIGGSIGSKVYAVMMTQKASVTKKS